MRRTPYILAGFLAAALSPLCIASGAWAQAAPPNSAPASYTAISVAQNASLSATASSNVPRAVPPPGMKREVSLGQMAEVLADLANVRQGPSVRQPVIGRVSQGDTFVLREEKRGWFRIRLAGGRMGWIYGELIKPRGVASLSPEPKQEVVKIEVNHLSRGNQFYLMKRFDQAIQQFDRALEMNPRDIDALYNLALAREEAHQAREAISTYQQALQLKPTYVSALVNLGRLLYHDNQMEQAVVHWKKAIEAKPRHPSAHFNLAVAYEKLDPQKAAEQWQTYLSVTKNNSIQAEWRQVAQRHLAQLSSN